MVILWRTATPNRWAVYKQKLGYAHIAYGNLPPEMSWLSNVERARLVLTGNCDKPWSRETFDISMENLRRLQEALRARLEREQWERVAFWQDDLP